MNEFDSHKSFFFKGLSIISECHTAIKGNWGIFLKFSFHKQKFSARALSFLFSYETQQREKTLNRGQVAVVASTESG